MIGYTDVCEVDFSFAMELTRVHEDPRVTKPYSDAQWAAIRDLGRQVDEDLAKHDVRLTQGGEPTFVSVDDMAAEFDLDRLGRSAAIFDPVKLDWISAQYVHAMPPDRLTAEVASALVRASRLDASGSASASPWISAVAEFLRPALGR